MKKWIIAVCLILGLSATAYAGEGRRDSCDGYKGKLLNRCHAVTHPERDNPIGVGADVLLVETENVDLVAEYKYDEPNQEHSIFLVFKTKKALWDYVKDLLNKGE